MGRGCRKLASSTTGNAAKKIRIRVADRMLEMDGQGGEAEHRDRIAALRKTRGTG